VATKLEMLIFYLRRQAANRPGNVSVSLICY